MLKKIFNFFKSLFSNEITQETQVNKKTIKNNIKNNSDSEIKITNNIGDQSGEKDK